MKQFDPDFPIVLGLAGKAATGKTVTANGLAPAARVVKGDEEGIYWDHLYFAMPLYQMANARQTIQGEKAFDRQCYEIHRILVEIFGNSPLHGAPDYPQLVNMVLEIAELPIDLEGKPRTFLQKTGTEICRAYDTDCWVTWMKQKVNKEFSEWRKENRPQYNYTLNEEEVNDWNVPDIDTGQVYGVVVSDVRFRNEAEFVYNHPNGLLIKLEASDDVLAERQLERDGVVMSTEQKSHASELELDTVPLEWYTRVLDTSDLTIKEQVYEVNSIATTYAGIR